MLTDCQDNKEYNKAVEVRGESHSAELFMAFIFQEQQKRSVTYYANTSCSRLKKHVYDY
jgi:hypothetical protein